MTLLERGPGSLACARVRDDRRVVTISPGVRDARVGGRAGIVLLGSAPWYVVHEARCQVLPLRISPLDQIELPCASPALDALLAADGAPWGFVELPPDEGLHVVGLGESIDVAALVLGHAADDVRRHAGIERASIAAGEDVDEEDFFHAPEVGARGV